MRRFRADVEDAIASEADTLGLYDFPLNKQLNGGTRAIMLPEGRSFNDYKVVNQPLAESAQAERGSGVSGVQGGLIRTS